MEGVILVINAGSSSIKFAVFSGTSRRLLYRGEIEHILEASCFTVFDGHQHLIRQQPVQGAGYDRGLHHLMHWVDEQRDHLRLIGIGHRVVHGGRDFLGPTLITEDVIAKIASLNALAPLHQPHHVDAMQWMLARFPTLPQVACFDTSFHHTQNKLATLFAIPYSLTEEGIVRYGFHGLSYEYIASVLPQYIKTHADGRVIVAHLGYGASLCAMKARQSVATSMGFTALDGLMMGTRCGAIDPGVILYLLQIKKMTPADISTLLYSESGLLGVSGVSGDVRELQLSSDPRALLAMDLFCYRAASELCALCVALQGCDAIVFTAGIGEHSAFIRQKICAQLAWLGVVLDEDANTNHASIISQSTSAIVVGVIPTQEEYMIAKHSMALLQVY